MTTNREQDGEFLGRQAEPAMDLENDILRLRKMNTSDAEQTLGWRLSSRARYLHAGALTIQDQKNWIRHRPDNELNFIIECICRTAVGMISLVDVDTERKRGEPARFIIPKAFSRAGFAVGACYLLYRFAFEDLGLSQLRGSIAEQNKGMVRWHEYFGMEVTGTAESAADIRGLGKKTVEISLSMRRYKDIALPRMTSYLSDVRSQLAKHVCACSMIGNSRSHP